MLRYLMNGMKASYYDECVLKVILCDFFNFTLKQFGNVQFPGPLCVER